MAAKSKTSKPREPHPCFTLVDKKLEEHNAALDLRMRFSFSTGEFRGSMLPVQVVKIDTKKRKRLPTILCTFCPFCGKKL